MKIKMAFLFGLATLSLTSCASTPAEPSIYENDRTPVQDQKKTTRDDQLTFFTTPEDMHHTWIQAINSAKSSILIEMFQLTDPLIVDALRAKSPHIKIDLILDSANLKEPQTLKIKNEILLGRPNIHVYPSSGPPDGFYQTHTEAMLVDGNSALITSINLTTNAAIQRDYGIVTSNSAIIDEIKKVFPADIANSVNSQNGKGPVKFTPKDIGLAKLIWSPNLSEERLVNLIQNAATIPDGPNKFLYVTVESLGDKPIENALSEAAKNGVDVRLIVPECVLDSGALNYDYFDKLKNGVHYKVMPSPSTTLHPYMHGKMILSGDGQVYIGSVNFSVNSTHDNRELGIIFINHAVASKIKAVFEQDWLQAQEVADSSVKPHCELNNTDPAQ